MNELDNFVRLSRYAGERFDLVQAGGGNTSCHLTSKTLLVKASGFSLSDVNPDSGYTKVSTAKVLDILNHEEISSMSGKGERNDRALKLMHLAAIDDGKRPSIETFLHILMSKYTLHVHPIVVSAVASQDDWQQVLKKLFPSAMAVDYKTPGIELAWELKECMQKYQQAYDRKPKIVFLQNHGMIVSCDNIKEVIALTEEVLLKIERYLGCDMQRYKLSNKISALINSKENRFVTHVCEDSQILRLLKTQRESFFAKPFCPDTRVYCGPATLQIKNLNDTQSVESYKAKYNEIPRVVIYEDLIFFLAENLRKAREAQETFKLHVMVLSLGNNLCKPLPEEELTYLGSWEAEQYRQKL